MLTAWTLGGNLQFKPGQRVAVVNPPSLELTDGVVAAIAASADGISIPPFLKCFFEFNCLQCQQRGTPLRFNCRQMIFQLHLYSAHDLWLQTLPADSRKPGRSGGRMM
jgi:hypothetical protein